VRTLEGHQYSVKSVVFSTDGLLFVLGSFDKAIRKWDAITGEIVPQSHSCLRRRHGQCPTEYCLSSRQNLD
ncbi:hypothetical protein CI102_8876, partial [Trichoderma harzianum]